METGGSKGFRRCLVVADECPGWVSGLRIPYVSSAEVSGIHVPDLDLVIIAADRVDRLNACMEWLSVRKDKLRPCVICFGDTYANSALSDGVDVFIHADAPDGHKIAQILALEVRFIAAQSTIRWLGNVTKKLTKIQSEYDAIDTELIEARKLQQALAQGQTVTFDSGEMSLYTRPFRQVSGDMVGHFPAGDRHVGFFIIDVAGHGITAALLTARIAGMLLGTSPDSNLALKRIHDKIVPNRPSQVVAKMNHLLFEDFETDHYFTCILGLLNIETGQVTFSQAGHPNPILLKVDEKPQNIGLGGLPVGLIPNADFADYKLTLSPGECLFLYSDGITECEARNTGFQLGDRGLHQLLARRRSIASNDLFDVLLSDLQAFQGHEDFEDDISGLMLTFRGDPKNNDVAKRSPGLAST